MDLATFRRKYQGHIVRWAIFGLLYVAVGLAALEWSRAKNTNQLITSHAIEYLFIGAGAIAMWKIPKLQVAKGGLKPTERFDRENEARSTLAQIIGGLLVLAGVHFSVKTLDLQRRTEDLQHDSQLTDRYTKAIEQLGASMAGTTFKASEKPVMNLEVRLGGMYALERMAGDSQKDQRTIMEVLAAYVRDNSPRREALAVKDPLCPEKPLKLLDSEDDHSTVDADIQAALTIIGRRNPDRDTDSDRDPPGKSLEIDLRCTSLNEADFEYAHLKDARFHKASLNKTLFNRAKLDGADLSNAYLDGAHLHCASLHWANLGTTNLVKADLTNADLRDVFLNRANLLGANLTGANLSEAKSLTESQLGKAFGDRSTILPKGMQAPSSWPQVAEPSSTEASCSQYPPEQH